VILLGMSIASSLVLASVYNLSANMFLDALGNDEFLETMTVYGNYGTYIYYKVCLSLAAMAMMCDIHHRHHVQSLCLVGC
jgi:hypothetical protein